MKRLLSLVLPAAVLALAGCGGDTCTSADAPLQNSGGGQQCTVNAGSTVTVQVATCGKCTDSNPSCQAEITNGQLEVAPVVQQCAANAACGTSASCAISPPIATCSVVAPSTPQQIPIVVGAGQVQNTLNVVSSGGSTTCSL